MLALLKFDPKTSLERKAFFRTCSLQIGNDVFSLDEIEHGVLRRNAKPPYSLSKLFASDDPRLAFCLQSDDARVHFALNCGALSSPAIETYEDVQVDAQLDAAALLYLQRTVKSSAASIVMPKVLYWYSGDFPKDILGYVRRYVPVSSGSLKINWSPFDWTSILDGSSVCDAILK